MGRPDVAVAIFRVPLLLWARMIFQLRRRGAGKGESGAFLLGKEGGAAGRVTKFICYDDLDPQAFRSGAITFHAGGYAALWERCRREKLEVLADVHTHPGESVQQSGIDRAHPMLPIVGHIATILPNYAYTPWWSLETLGVYEYLGDFQWRTYAGPQKGQRIRLTLW